MDKITPQPKSFIELTHKDFPLSKKTAELGKNSAWDRLVQSAKKQPTQLMRQEHEHEHIVKAEPKLRNASITCPTVSTKPPIPPKPAHLQKQHSEQQGDKPSTPETGMSKPKQPPPVAPKPQRPSQQ